MANDAEGRLRQTVITAPNVTTRNQLDDGVDMVDDYDGADVLMRRYVHGPGVDEPLVIYEGAGTGTKNWQYADHLGSIIATADATGTSTAIFTYGPFGESSLTTGQRYGYTGQRSMAALGLLYYKARFYSPSLGRFLQPDPIGYADDLNLYAYVGNNPVNFTDPSGLVANWAKGTALTGVNAATDFLTGGFGQRASQAINNGELGEALLYTGAGMAFGAMNVLTLGQGTVATGVAKGVLPEAAAKIDSAMIRALEKSVKEGATSVPIGAGAQLRAVAEAFRANVNEYAATNAARAQQIMESSLQAVDRLPRFKVLTEQAVNEVKAIIRSGLGR